MCAQRPPGTPLWPDRVGLGVTAAEQGAREGRGSLCCKVLGLCVMVVLVPGRSLHEEQIFLDCVMSNWDSSATLLLDNPVFISQRGADEAGIRLVALLALKSGLSSGHAPCCRALTRPGWTVRGMASGPRENTADLLAVGPACQGGQPLKQSSLS